MTATLLALDYDVVIPTHGRRFDLLLQAIDSIRHQAIGPRSIIVVVDGRPEVARRLGTERPEIRVLCLERPLGQAAARQRGIEESEAKWIAFLDDDDLWSPAKQTSMAAYLVEHPDCAAVRSGYWMFTAVDGLIGGINGQSVELRGDSLEELEHEARTAKRLNDLDYLEIRGDSLALMLEYNRGCISTSMVRRELLARVPAVPQGQRPGDDYLLFCGVARETEWHLLQSRLMYYRLHEGQDTRLGDPTGARAIISAKRLAWELSAGACTRPLASYGVTYRRELRQLAWPLVKRGAWTESIRLYRAARPLLPRRRDRLLGLVPEPVVWRLRQRFPRAVPGSPEGQRPPW